MKLFTVVWKNALKVSLPDLQLQESESRVSSGTCLLPCGHFPFSNLWLNDTSLARKTKKKIKGIQQTNVTGTRDVSETSGNKSIVPASLPQLTPTLVSLLEVIEPEVLYSGYDSSLPDSSWRILSTLNMLGGRQVVAAVKWAKAIPGNTQIRELQRAGFLWYLKSVFVFGILQSRHRESFSSIWANSCLTGVEKQKKTHAKIYLLGLQVRSFCLNPLTIEC